MPPKNLLLTFRRGGHCFHFYRKKKKNSAESSRVNKLKRWLKKIKGLPARVKKKRRQQGKKSEDWH